MGARPSPLGAPHAATRSPSPPNRSPSKPLGPGLEVTDEDQPQDAQGDEEGLLRVHVPLLPAAPPTEGVRSFLPAPSEKGLTLAPHRLRTNHPDDEQHRAE